MTTPKQIIKELAESLDDLADLNDRASVLAFEAGHDEEADAFNENRLTLKAAASVLQTHLLLCVAARERE